MTDPEKQNELFTDAAKKVFEALTAGQRSAPALFDALLQGADESRLLEWSDDGQEEELLESTVLAGRLTNEATTSPRMPKSR